MAIFQDGASPDNDDLFKSGLTSKEVTINQQRTDPQFQYGGYSGQDRTTGASYGPSGAQDAAREYRLQGSTSQLREGPQLQYGAANQSLGRAEGAIGAAGQGIQDAQTARMAQYGALDSIARAANGQQPSRAEILGKNMIGQSLKAQVAGAASVGGGPLAQASARRQVAQNAAGFQQQGVNQLSALRADEMERARNQWMQGAGAIRGQDYQGSQAQLNQGLAYGQVGGQRAQMAQAQGQMDMSQRGLNQQDRQFFEGLGYQVQNDQANRNLTNEMDRRNAAERHWEVQGGMNQGARQKETGAVLGFGGGVLGGIMGSDVRMKQPANLGEKSLLLQGGAKPKAASPSWLDGYMEAEGAKDEARRQTQEHEMRLRESSGKKEDPYEVPDWLKASEAPDLPGGRDDPYAAPTPGGIQRQDPYGGQYNPRTQQVDPSLAPVYFGSTAPEKEELTQGQKVGMGVSKGLTDAGKVYSSDDKTKLAAAFWEGASAHKKNPKGVYSTDELPSYVRETEQGKIKPSPQQSTGQYDSHLTPEGEQRFQEWKKRFAPNDSGADYDLRGAFKAGEVPGADGHWTDRFKKPNHPTFSDQSQYAKGADAGKAGRWEGEKFIPPSPSSGEQKPTPPREMKGFYRDKRPDNGKTSQLEEDANRRLAGSAWTYRPEHAPQGEAPGQLHYGGMAQNYEGNPITNTTVRKNPQTGMREIDMPSMMQVQGAGIASLQKQLDELKGGRRG